LAKRCINDLIVKCPRQYQQETQIYQKGEEGRSYENAQIKCDFKGKIENLNDHLNDSCPLKFEECWFKSFGCNCLYFKHELENSYVLKIKYHFDLVMTKFESMQQTINQLQEEARKLRLENVKLKAGMEVNGKIQYGTVLKIQCENVILEQQLLQQQQNILNSNDQQRKIRNELTKIKPVTSAELSGIQSLQPPFNNGDVTVRFADNTIVQSGVIRNKELNAPTGIKSIIHPLSSQSNVMMRETQSQMLLTHANAQKEKRMIGEQLFPMVRLVEPRLAGKITGMLLEMENNQLLMLLNNEDLLRIKINETMSVLKKYHKKQSLRKGNKIRQQTEPQND
ncbi:hypothetical protein RFI_37755, partial [Reticulomyxa filosa]